MTDEHEDDLTQTPGGARVVTLAETATEEAATATAASDEESNKWSMEKLRQDILSQSPGSDEKN